MKILIYHDSLFSIKTGSTEKLLQDVGRAFLKWSDASVCFYHGFHEDNHISPDLLKNKRCTIQQFNFSLRQNKRPYRCLNMYPPIDMVLNDFKPDIFIGAIWDDRQFPYIDLP